MAEFKAHENMCKKLNVMPATEHIILSYENSSRWIWGLCR